MRPTIIVVTLLALTAAARADRPIRVGALGKANDRAAIEAALDTAFRGMTPCFRTATGTIKVRIEVLADGEVASATPSARTGSAQCIAGLLAVTKFPAGAWRADVEVDAVKPEQWLANELGKHQPALSACQDKDPAGKGEVPLQLAISRTGVVSAVSVDKATTSKPIADCAKAAALRIALGPLPGGADVKYRLVVGYRGTTTGGKPVATTTDAGTGEAGSVKGALAATAVQKAWSEKRAPVLACGSKLGKAAAVTLGFAIRANGTVKNVTFKQSAVGAKVEDCMEKAVRALTFPTASGETLVSLPVSWAR